jgi:hypothetical protein
LSPGDRNNDLLNKIANIIENSENAKDAIPIFELVASSNFPNNAIGKVVQIKDTIGRVSGISEDNSSLCLIDFKTGEAKKFKIANLKENFQKTHEPSYNSAKKENSSVSNSSPTPIAHLVAKGNFPDSALGELVQIQDIVGHICYVSGNRQTFAIKEISSSNVLNLNTFEVIKRVRETSLEKQVSQNNSSTNANSSAETRPKKVFTVKNQNEQISGKTNNSAQSQPISNKPVSQKEVHSKTVFGGNLVTDISLFVCKPNFPRCAMGQFIQIDNKIGKITKISVDEQTFTFQDYKTSQKHTYDVVRMMAIYGKK